MEFAGYFTSNEQLTDITRFPILDEDSDGARGVAIFYTPGIDAPISCRTYVYDAQKSSWVASQSEEDYDINTFTEVFKGYYTSDETLADTSAFPQNPNLGDGVIAVHQNAENTVRMARRYSRVLLDGDEVWFREGADKHIDSTSPNFKPFENRALNVYEPYAMGIFSMLYAYVDYVALPSWRNSDSNIGSDEVDSANLTFHDVLSGNEVTQLPTTIGLVPVYIRGVGGVILGVGSAAYMGSWRVLWQKVNVGSGMPPTVAVSGDYVNTYGKFIMNGDTSGMRVRVKSAERNSSVFEDYTGIFDGTRTTYDIIEFIPLHGLWGEVVLLDQQATPIYQLTNSFGVALDFTQGRVQAIEETYPDMIDSKIPKSVSDNILTGASIDDTAGSVALKFAGVNPSTSATTEAVLEMPVVSSVAKGLMTPLLYDTLMNLSKSGGKWIGVNFDTRTLLLAHTDFSDYNAGDYTYVLVDEALSDVRTLWVVVEKDWVKSFAFSRQDTEAVVVAGSGLLGSVLSSSDPFEVSVSEFGVMTVNGLAALANQVATLMPRVAALELAMGAAVADGGVLAGQNVRDALSIVNGIVSGDTPATINHIL